MGWWCLTAATLWWPLAYMMPTYIAHPYRPADWFTTHPQPAPAGLVFYLLWLKLALWSFSVVWTVGMLVVFRETFNKAPGPLWGRQIIAGAYGAYIIHPLFIPLWAWAFMRVPFTTFTGYAICISPLVVASSWVFTALVRLVPGTKRVLG